MKRDLRTAFRWSVFAAVACCSIGCRIDDGGNPAFRDGTCDAGTYRGFCLPPEDGPAQARRDAALPDAGDEPTHPSTPGEPCARENEERLCYDGVPSTQAVGKCTSGIQRCIDEHWSDCAGQVLPADETCNGDDDDCDGHTDEGAQGDCVVDTTGCKGELSCRKGKSVCSAVQDPEKETCNGRDDDCDGDVDEDSDRPCTVDNPGCSSDAEGEIHCIGTCTAGVQRCEDGALVVACDEQGLPRDTERCDKGALAYDDDCDGKVDEECACSGSTWRGCYIASADPNTGAMCQPGRQDCDDGTWGTCTGAATPHAEKCPGDGVDDDCNGLVDDVKGEGDDCVSSRPGRCRNGKKVCRGDELICETPSGVDETCNGIDDDCDGETDEPYDLENDRNHCGKCSTKCAANRDCCEGECVDLKTDRDHCNMCGAFCPAGYECCDASCTSFKSDHENCGECGHACGATEQCCRGECVDVMTDERYCGACTIFCDEEAEMQTCVEGVCTST